LSFLVLGVASGRTFEADLGRIYLIRGLGGVITPLKKLVHRQFGTKGFVVVQEACFD